MALKDWKKLRSNLWLKGTKSVEIFQDVSWRSDNANVIVRDKRKGSYESSLGKTLLVKYFDKKSQAIRFAKTYMRKH